MSFFGLNIHAYLQNTNIMKIIFTLFIICNFTFSVQSQTNVPRVESISFAQGYGGVRSEILKTVEVYIKVKEYSKIILLLESTSITDRFVGSIICSRIVTDFKITLTQENSDRIKVIQEGGDLISFNSGCTCRQVITINSYFKGENACGFRRDMDRWVLELTKKCYQSILK
jgi:hypothetical protein